MVKKGGAILHISKKDKRQTEIVIKFIFYLLIRYNLSSLQSFVNNNENNSYNIFIQMINGVNVWYDTDNNITVYFNKYYNKIVKSNSFYIVFPQEYNFYSKLQRETYENKVQNKKNSKKTQKKTTQSKTQKKTTQSKTQKMITYNEFLKQNANENNNDKIDNELAILYRYVYLALYLKYKLIQFLSNKYSEKYSNSLDSEINRKIQDLLNFYYKFSNMNTKINFYINEVKYTISKLKPLFKDKYGCYIKKHLLHSLEKGNEINTNKLFTLSIDYVPQYIELLYNEINEYYRLIDLMER
jgi:hypothetical protein